MRFDIQRVRLFTAMIAVDRGEAKTNTLYPPLEIAVNDLVDACDEIERLRAECLAARAVVDVARATHLLSFGSSLITPKRNAERLSAHRNLAAAIAAYDQLVAGEGTWPRG